jgi:eukaryotic-like serine/threonine-protein kinase
VKFNLLPTLGALIAIRHGDPQRALELLGPAERYDLAFLGCCSVGFVGSLYPVYARGEAHLALHHGAEAAAQFQKILDYRGLAGSNPIGLMAHWRKGKALAMAAKNEEAKAEYKLFLSLWNGADRDVPILRQVKAEYERLLQAKA